VCVFKLDGSIAGQENDGEQERVSTSTMAENTEASEKEREEEEEEREMSFNRGNSTLEEGDRSGSTNNALERSFVIVNDAVEPEGDTVEGEREQQTNGGRGGILQECEVESVRLLAASGGGGGEASDVRASVSDGSEGEGEEDVSDDDAEEENSMVDHQKGAKEPAFVVVLGENKGKEGKKNKKKENREWVEIDIDQRYAELLKSAATLRASLECSAEEVQQV